MGRNFVPFLGVIMTFGKLRRNAAHGLFGAALLLISPVAAWAQTTPMVIDDVAKAQTFLPKGTSIRLRTLQELSSKDSKVGLRFDLETAEDILLNGRIVIPRGSPAVGDVTMVKKKGMWGKSGKLEARVLSIRANGKDIPVRGIVNDKGDAGTAGVVGSILVLPIAGFFVTGTSAVLPAGTGANALLETDLPIVFAEAAVPAVEAAKSSVLPMIALPVTPK
jgi:hypothetical protein